MGECNRAAFQGGLNADASRRLLSLRRDQLQRRRATRHTHISAAIVRSAATGDCVVYPCVIEQLIDRGCHATRLASFRVITRDRAAEPINLIVTEGCYRIEWTGARVANAWRARYRRVPFVAARLTRWIDSGFSVAVVALSQPSVEKVPVDLGAPDDSSPTLTTQ
jgi:hypothetical protein